MNKHILNSTFLAVLCAMLFVNCSQDELDLAPLSAIGDNGFYQTTEEVEGAVIAIYDGLQEVPLREFALSEMRSDNSRTKSSEGDWAQFQELAVQPTNLVVGSYWAANYNVIFRANRVIENLDAVTDASLRDQFEGEAKFARALCHFNLVRAYGDVPLLDKVIGPEESDYFSRVDASTVYAAIDSDLTDAMGKLPSDMAFGRASKAAAQGILAKVKLTNGDYSGAQALCSSIIDGGNHSLMGDYHDVFYNEGNSEIIFAIPYIGDDANESQDFSFEMTAGGVVSGLNFYTDEFALVVEEGDKRDSTLFNYATIDADVGKFLTQSADARLCGNDWIVLRHADVLLMYAEAIMAGGASTSSFDAVDAVNQVRERAGLSEIEGSLTEDMLLHERRVELAFENHRMYDLVRFGKAISVLGDFAAANGYTFTATDLLLPIPQNEINVSNGALTQNPGY